MINYWLAFFVVSLISSVAVEADNVCSVQPTVTAIVVGERVSLNCNGSNPIDNWQIGIHVENKTVVYTSQLFGRNEAVRRNRYVADGYSLSEETENKVSLFINQVQLSQAGLYACQCGGGQSQIIAKTVVVVLASEPQFSNISSVINGQQVSFFCNVSFNGSADVSCNLTIEDVSGNTINRTVCSPNNVLTFCNLKYAVTADASVDQSYTCTVRLITNNNIIYSKIINSSLEWRRVSRADIVVSNPDKCSAKICFAGVNITCQIDGEPGITFFKWWKIPNNGSVSRVIGDGNQHLVLNEVGQFTYQCQAYSIIRGVNTSATSEQFTIAVTENNDNVSPSILTVIGIAVAIGVVAIIIAVVATCVCCSKKPKSRTFRALSTGDSSAAPLRQPANRYDKTKLNNPVHQGSASTSATDPVYATAAPRNNNTSVGTEVVVFDNDLYEGARCASPNLDIPLAGCIPEEGIYNEIRILE